MSGDPFLSDPSKKRKRASKVTSTIRKSNKSSRDTTPAIENDEEISSESETEAIEQEDGENEELDSDEEFATENAADKRRRLAKQYLDNLKADEYDFDAKDMDDDIIGRRLQIDVAENQGHVYKFWGDKISSQLDDEQVKAQTTRIGSKNVTALAVRYPNLYTVSKDTELIKWNVEKKKPQRIRHTKGGMKYVKLHKAPHLNHHCDQINCVAVSSDGKYVVTGGSDCRLIIWSSETLSCLKVLETRAAVNSITFRRGSDQLYAACADLKIRTFSINQFAQLEVLYGHQDNISDISALTRETCVSVGSRDKSAMFWKISEESRLTFRGGDSTEKRKNKKNKKLDDNDDHDEQNEDDFFYEGSIDVVSMIDESHFVTGSDNGNVSLWSLAKKKSLYGKRVAHGLEPKIESSLASAETNINAALAQIPKPQPYWITTIHAVPFSDIFLTGSYNGEVKIWRLDDNLRSFACIGHIGNVNGCIVSIESAEVDKRLVCYVLVSKEHKLGRWLGKIEGARNALVQFAFDI
ncbi:pre-rRNA processing protein [Scheffersomyces spartinae]|uniref:Pre-rRNA processing protein n=1 Tax=Scheffersomyces spartinae TaxID=45513 RepID=A0A9P7V9F6_9ASCO|nr:pre-rRNA processing protein [Scheffersomyces spartinae]KAG7193743.1 pre-rRNA processing protein [Scheffersomyces spartinae]